MPLTGTGTVPAQREDSTPQFLVFFSSGNPPWCPDCVDALSSIRAVFETHPDTKHGDAHMVLVGERAEWKTPENRFRKEYGIKCIPTMTKVVKGIEVGRLEDSECKDVATLAAFVLQ